ncbi:MAG: helix-turn-helix transcriptional regulator [Candidatus Improbicoccus devescovinae]|nr:MAG: helix-turn-helix transcriptional regulator [Candidatus Improbicoccus devescovinae]GMB10650.1 MAG: helix-turn-helix transcriptional regulator [Candidatus Improbicoccus devescovinae]
MDTTQRFKIQRMREDGESYTKIAGVTGVSANTIKSFCRRNNFKVLKIKDDKSQNFCKNCSKALILDKKTKPEKFCCKTCKNRCWNKNRNIYTNKPKNIVICKHCGKKFTDYQNSKRIYCSHQCYINFRYKSP